MTPNQWNRNTRDSVVTLLTEAGFSEDSSVINQLECMNFDAPAAPQSDSVIVPRELRSVLAMILNALDRDAAGGKQVRGEMADELRALLGGDQPAQTGSAKGGEE